MYEQHFDKFQVKKVNICNHYFYSAVLDDRFVCFGVRDHVFYLTEIKRRAELRDQT